MTRITTNDSNHIFRIFILSVFWWFSSTHVPSASIDGKDLWLMMQPDIRRGLSCFGFTFEELWCSHLFIVTGYHGHMLHPKQSTDESSQTAFSFAGICWSISHTANMAKWHACLAIFTHACHERLDTVPLVHLDIFLHMHSPSLPFTLISLSRLANINFHDRPQHHNIFSCKVYHLLKRYSIFESLIPVMTLTPAHL